MRADPVPLADAEPAHMRRATMKVVIADDEPLARERLRGAARASCRGVRGRRPRPATAARRCTPAPSTDPDLVLLDIAMPGIDGLEAARHLAAFEPRPAVVFCTAYDAHALSAFEAAAVDYLVKPVRPRAPGRGARARAHLRRRPRAGRRRAERPRRSAARHLCARLRGSLRLIPIEDVHYLQAEEKYVVVHHARGEDLIEESLKSLEEEFGERFVRIHRNCLVARRRDRRTAPRRPTATCRRCCATAKRAAGSQPALRGRSCATRSKHL